MTSYGNDNKDILEKEKHQLIQDLRSRGWTINYDKTTGPSTEVKFLGITWSSEGRKIPQKVLDKIQCITTPTDKQEAQRLT